jgi:uncharacterized protein (DUF2236 family)
VAPPTGPRPTSTGGQASENFAVLITTGFLPQKFRDEMRLPWSPQHLRRFQEFRFNLTLRELDRRMWTGRPLV